VEACLLFERAERWLDHDPDESTRKELGALLAEARSGNARSLSELADRFIGPLEFGTGGLRGILGAGESRMNRAVVRRATLGLGHYLLEQAAPLARSGGVVVGYDGRRMGRELAEEAALVLAGLGIVAKLTNRPSTTPLVAYAVTALGAAAGVIVTASHNPRDYNGYKVYWQNGAQIIPPHDAGIAAHIATAPDANEIVLAQREQAEAEGLLQSIGEGIDRRYLDAIRSLSVRSDGDRSFPIVYTPLHGTGDRFTRTALVEAGFTDVTTVPEQAEPDGAFPTVAFPNPEEKGALDLAIALAKQRDAALVLANDPDVDRLAVAVRGADGTFVPLTGNEVGGLLGYYLLTEGEHSAERRFVLTSVVSSPLLRVIAHELGVYYEETLTGCKWIANRAIELEAERGRFVFGFEESVGYCVGSVVRDKDGVSAALLVAELAAVCRARGQSLLDALEAQSRRFGLFVSAQRSVTLPGTNGSARITEMMKRLRAEPPWRIGGVDVSVVADYAVQRSCSRDRTTRSIPLPRTNMLVFELQDGSRAVARPSGTEPKIKFYFDVRETMGAGEPVGDARRRAMAHLGDLQDAFLALAVASG
jgi:phosphomannomutase